MFFFLIICYDRVFKGEIRRFTVKKGELTASIHGKERPQLECYSDERWICENHGPNAIICNNRASQTNPKPDWTCTPLNWSVRHQIIESRIECEGWDNPKDDFVVDGSCFVDIRMVYDRVQIQVDQSVFTLTIPLAFLFVIIICTMTSCVWISTYGTSRYSQNVGRKEKEQDGNTKEKTKEKPE